MYWSISEIFLQYQVDFESDPLSNNMRFLMKQNSLGTEPRLNLDRFYSPWSERGGEGLVTVGSKLKRIFSFYWKIRGKSQWFSDLSHSPIPYSVQHSAILPVRLTEVSRLFFHVPLIHLCKCTCCEIFLGGLFEGPMFHQTDNCSMPDSAHRFPRQRTEAELLWMCFVSDAELFVRLFNGRGYEWSRTNYLKTIVNLSAVD